MGVDTQILGVTLSQQQGIQGLDKQQSRCNTSQTDDDKGRHLFHGDASEVTQSPHHIRLHTLFRGEEVEQRDGRRGDIPDHDTDDEQHHAVAHHGGKHQYQGHHQHGPHEGCRQRSHESRQRESPSRDTTSHEQHYQRHTQRGSTVDTEDAGICQRIPESRLQHQSAHRQRSPAEHGRDTLR